MRKDRFKVIFCLKERETNLLVDKEQTCESMQDAISYVKHIKQQYVLVGKPIIETL